MPVRDAKQAKIGHLFTGDLPKEFNRQSVMRWRTPILRYERYDFRVTVITVGLIAFVFPSDRGLSQHKPTLLRSLALTYPVHLWTAEMGRLAQPADSSWRRPCAPRLPSPYRGPAAGRCLRNKG